MVNFTVWRVYIFLRHAFCHGIKQTTSKADNLSTLSEPREDYATSKPVYQFATVSLLAYTRLFEIFALVTFRNSLLCQSLTVSKVKAEFEPLYDVVPKTTTAEIR